MRKAKKYQQSGTLHVPENRQRMSMASVTRQADQMKKIIVVEFIKDHVLHHADFMPHLWEAHLPAQTLADLYRSYRTYADIKELSPVTQQYFGKIFNNNFQAYVKFPPTRAFARCQTCDDLDDMIKQTKTDVMRDHFAMKKDQHLRACRAEQEQYLKNRRLAVLYPEKYMSIAIDAMDQSKTSVPNIRNSSKKYSEVNQMTVSLMGVIIHGHMPGAVIFPVTPQFPKDGSLVMQVLLNTLKMVREQSGTSKWPRTLFLQLDNAPNQNKCRAIFGVLSALVQIGLFDRVCICVHINYVIYY